MLTPSDTLLQPAPMLDALSIAKGFHHLCSASKRLLSRRISKCDGGLLANVNGKAPSFNFWQKCLSCPYR